MRIILGEASASGDQLGPVTIPPGRYTLLVTSPGADPCAVWWDGFHVFEARKDYSWPETIIRQEQSDVCPSVVQTPGAGALFILARIGDV